MQVTEFRKSVRFRQEFLRIYYIFRSILTRSKKKRQKPVEIELRKGRKRIKLEKKSQRNLGIIRIRLRKIDQMTVEDDLLFLDSYKLIQYHLPMRELHNTTKTKTKRAGQTLYWPGHNRNIENLIEWKLLINLKKKNLLIFAIWFVRIRTICQEIGF